MSIASWSVPFTLSNQFGDLEINALETFATTSGIYKLVPSNCEFLIPLRSTDNNIPVADGEETYPRYYSGAQMKLAVQLWETDDKIACDTVAQEMLDTLAKWIRGFAKPSDFPNSRIYWTPDGADERMLKRVILDEPHTTTLADGGALEVSFRVKSPYPYAMTYAETTTPLSAVITNLGTAPFWPVIRLSNVAASTTVTIENTSQVDEYGNTLKIVYNGTAIPASPQYLEIDTFFGTMYLNGNGADLSSGLVLPDSTTFPLGVGANVITIAGGGATADVLWNHAWA